MNKTITPRRLDYKPGDSVLYKYRIIKALGDGTFGQVYKVSDIYNNVYAFKILRLWDVTSENRDELVKRFELEYKTGQIQSKYLVHSIERGFIEGNPYIIMEYCPGGDLTQMIGRHDADFPKIAHDVLCGLRDLHYNGKVHRDLKPENVLFNGNNDAVLADFGICGNRNGTRLTGTTWWGKPVQIFGTYAYMPPEQIDRARGGVTVLPTTDIFSFGVLIYQLLTGKLPFGNLNNREDLVLYQKREKAGDWDKTELIRVKESSMWMNIISGCLQPDYKNRVQNAENIIGMLPMTSPYYAKPQNVRKANPTGALLRVLHGEEFGRIYDITKIASMVNRRALTLGRISDNDIHIEERNNIFISRRHATLECDNERKNWCIRDGQWSSEERQWLQSSNGTFVNSAMVNTKGFYLEPNDIITIGETKLRFEEY